MLCDGTWKVEYFDVYTRGYDYLGEDGYTRVLKDHFENLGEITFEAGHTGKIVNGSYSKNFTWSIAEGVLRFDFNANTNTPAAHPIIYYFFGSSSSFCNSDVTQYSIIKSSKDVYVFRFREGGSSSCEEYYCVEFGISKSN